jgi:hypothetical protein
MSAGSQHEVEDLLFRFWTEHLHVTSSDNPANTLATVEHTLEVN